MGNQLGTECCGPCSLDQKGVKAMKDMEDVRPFAAEDKRKDRLETVAEGDTGANPATPNKNYTFRNMNRQDYFTLYDAIHTLVRQDEITKEQENQLYDLIGRQDKNLATSYAKYKDSGDPTALLEPLRMKAKC